MTNKELKIHFENMFDRIIEDEDNGEWNLRYYKASYVSYCLNLAKFAYQAGLKKAIDELGSIQTKMVQKVQIFIIG